MLRLGERGPVMARQFGQVRRVVVAHCFVNLLGGLIAYTWREKKSSLNFRVKEQLQLVF